MQKTRKKRSILFSSICLAYIILYLISLATLNIYVITPAHLFFTEGGIYYGTLLPLQGIAILFYLIIGGMVTVPAGFLLVAKIGENIATWWTNGKAEAKFLIRTSDNWSTQETYPFEIVKTITKIVDYAKAHAYRTGIPLIALGPIIWSAFNLWINRVNHQSSAYYITQTEVYQLLNCLVPIASIIITITGIILIASKLVKKRDCLSKQTGLVVATAVYAIDFHIAC